MQKYSHFFQTLYDQAEPVGHLGRGTHYSILRATVFHAPSGAVMPEAAFHDFAVFWDEDHDTRVVLVIEEIYRAGILPAFTMFGERKGTITAILGERPRNPTLIGQLRKKVQEIALRATGDDVWSADVYAMEDPNNSIISDTDEKVQLYLSSVQMLWRLGSSKIASALTAAG